MNWLAHIFLSENHIEHQLGNLLTDPLKGKVWEGAGERIRRGIMMHMHIDTFTDAHMHGVVDAFRRIDVRLSDRARSKDNCARYIPLIAEHKEDLEADFLQFFPELLESVAAKCLREDVGHWRL